MNFFLIPAFLMTNLIAIYNSSDVITWDAKYALRNSDFKMSPPPSQTTNIKARGCFRIETDYDIAEGFFRFKTRALFYKDSSWISDSSALLTHIQNQFNLHEIYARIIRKELTSLKLKTANIDDYINSKIRSVLAKFNTEARRFDLESLNGDNQEYEKKWEQYIKRELEDLNDYSSQEDRFVNF